MNNHTPGPWVIEAPEGNFVAISASKHGELATVVWQMEEARDEGVSSPECEANAWLIAAAPNLLEALEELRKAFVLSVGDSSPFARCALSKTDDAIARARGEA